MIRIQPKLAFGLMATTLLLGGCTTPYIPPPVSVNGPSRSNIGIRSRPRRLIHILYQVIGAPYRYGGDTPRSGFDCSGLVFWASHTAGYRGVPRTVREQYQELPHVRLTRLQPGDVLFFHFHRGLPSHEGLYLGHHRFIHAPRTGGTVRIASLENPFWSHHLIAAARLSR